MRAVTSNRELTLVVRVCRPVQEASSRECGVNRRFRCVPHYYSRLWVVVVVAVIVVVVVEVAVVADVRLEGGDFCWDMRVWS